MIIFIPRISQASEELLANSMNEKTCEEIGMIANDASKDSMNYSLLCNALNAGTKILVDDKYYIFGSSKSTVITKNIYIEGSTDNAEFYFTNTAGTNYLFDIQATELIMKRVRFIQLSDGYIYAFRIKNGQKLDNFVIENCYFEGNIRLLTWTFITNSSKQYLDPTVTDFGISHFVFNYNTCKNLKEDFHGFIFLDNVPISHAELIGNDIKNFVYVFYNQGITNENPFVIKTAEQMSYLEVRDNIVTSDSSWNGAPRDDQMYHCFVLFEGNKCDYFNNHIEGLHTIDQATVVYDAYLNCWDLDYEDNYWKNNITFSSTKKYGDLMKSKGTNKAEYNGVKRLYKNNTYIVEKSYADVFGRPYEELWVSLSDYQSEMDTVIVENNIFDVYKLTMSYAEPIHNYTFSNNEVHAYATMETTTNCILPVFDLANPSPTDTYKAENNKIIIDTPSDYTGKQNSLISVTGQQDVVKEVKIVFENNYVDWPNLDAIISSRLNNIPIISDVRVVNNTIVTTKPTTSEGKTLYSGIYDVYQDLVFDNDIKATVSPLADASTITLATN